MSATSIKHFDTLSYVEKSKELGVNENVAKYQARQIEQAIDIAVDTARAEIENKELVTKGDIKNLETQIHEVREQIHEVRKQIHEVRAEIHKAKFDVVIWIIGLLIVSGVLQHFFK